MKLNIQQLEQIFSTNNSSSIFPILANMYYQKKLYKYSIKVCEIGLEACADDLEGLYIMAKTLLIKGKVQKAEQILQRIITKFPAHLHSNLLLICILEDTNKNNILLRSIIKKLNYFYPDQPKVQAYYQKYCSVHIAKNSIEEKPSINYKKHISSTIFHDNPKLATPTMYKLLISQNKHEDALALLKILETNARHRKFAKAEIKTIKTK